MIKMLFYKYKPHQGKFVKSFPPTSPTKKRGEEEMEKDLTLDSFVLS